MACLMGLPGTIGAGGVQGALREPHIEVHVEVVERL